MLPRFCRGLHVHYIDIHHVFVKFVLDVLDPISMSSYKNINTESTLYGKHNNGIISNLILFSKSHFFLFFFVVVKDDKNQQREIIKIFKIMY